MDYIIGIALFAGGGWTGYLLGQFSGIKEMNRRLNALVAERNEAIGEIVRQADVIATLQAKVPARNARGKFVAR